MYYVNKSVGWCVSPMGIALVGLGISWAVGALTQRLGDTEFFGRRLRRVVMVVTLVWLWVWATPMMTRIVGVSLEREFLVEGMVPRIEDLPTADAIELHGGSMGFSEEIGSRGEMWTSADRVWMAARLWKAGKAPVVYVTGTGAPEATLGLLEDFGVSTNALVMADAPRNTEEEAKLIAERLVGSERKPRVLVVTSAWHMKRTMLMYEKYAPGVDAIPAPCDWENTMVASGEWSVLDFLPSAQAFLYNSVTFHEWVGIVGYKWFR